MLFAEHTAAWLARSNDGRIEVAGDLPLAQAINASLYYIRSSIRPDWYYGMSPGGLASDGSVLIMWLVFVVMIYVHTIRYNGHSFWDVETWMYPSILMLEPQSAVSLVFVCSIATLA